MLRHTLALAHGAEVDAEMDEYERQRQSEAAEQRNLGKIGRTLQLSGDGQSKSGHLSFPIGLPAISTNGPCGTIEG